MERACCYPVYLPMLHNLKFQLGWPHASFLLSSESEGPDDNCKRNVKKKNLKKGPFKKNLWVFWRTVSPFGKGKVFKKRQIGAFFIKHFTLAGPKKASSRVCSHITWANTLSLLQSWKFYILQGAPSLSSFDYQWKNRP